MQQQLRIAIPARPIARLAYGAMFLLFAAVILGCAAYLFQNYNSLNTRFRMLQNCMYRQQFWERDYFSPQTKQTGNYWCLAGMIVSLPLLVKSIEHYRKQQRRVIILRIPIIDIVTLGGLLFVALALWVQSNSNSPVAFDEAFSALYIAARHPFHSIAYYALPNNHMLFNLLNHFVPITEKVISGRLLSLVAYLGCTASVYMAARQLKVNIVISALATLLVISQCFAWGFAAQARGYMLYLLLEVGTVFCTIMYVQHTNTRWLQLLALFTALGYFVMPSFLYWHLGLFISTALLFTNNRKQLGTLVKYYFNAVAMAIICYLPAIAFSGMRALTGNAYVAPMARYKTVADFLNWAIPYCEPYTRHIFTNVQAWGHSLNIILLISPVIMLLAKRNSYYFKLAIFYIASWLSLFAMIVLMKRVPFERNLIGHYSLAVVSVFATCCWLIQRLKLNKQITTMLVTIPAITILWQDKSQNPMMVKDVLYEYNVGATYTDFYNRLNCIPTAVNVGYSDEAFYPAYITTHRHCRLVDCTMLPDYYITTHNEALPTLIRSKCVLVQAISDYDVYRLVKP